MDWINRQKAHTAKTLGCAIPEEPKPEEPKPDADAQLRNEGMITCDYESPADIRENALKAYAEMPIAFSALPTPKVPR